ncbi:40S ribosomal protein S23-like [Hibiscus syriacus]|uniref:40S ribosomal protein S23-like n=1 Tax=Hibiscus syriacus TaxID=106335 RepID=A0A6A2WMH1_HIBSY|nr:40S ribosomal protein S23-like [Hibiscus syriacus]
MQTPNISKTSSLEVPRRKSSAAPCTAHQMKMSGSDAEAVSSLNPASKTHKERGLKVNERKASRSPVSEVFAWSLLNANWKQLNQLQDDLKRTKDQLTASESWKRQALQEAEEAKKQLSEMSAKLEESEQQLLEISVSEDDRVQELRKISQDRDRAWQSELDAVQKQKKMDSIALASALNEIQRLKVQLEKAYESEAIQIKHAESAHSEIQNLRIELTETLALVEKLKSNITNCRESETMAIEDFEDSKARVESLEGLVSKLQEELVTNSSNNGEKEEMEKLKTELKFTKLEAGQLRSALDASEIRYQEEYIRSTLQIRSANEQLECIRTQSCQRESELEAKLKKTKAEVEELRAKLMDKETELLSTSTDNEELNSKIEKQLELAMELKKLEADLSEMKANLTAKEIKLHSVIDQNEKLKMDSNKLSDESAVLLEAARSAEQEALKKLDKLTEAAKKSSKRADFVTEQLESAQAANTEMEAELRKIKVQSHQWRKAAEAATAMLSTGNNGKHMDQIISFDSNHNLISASPNSEDSDDDSQKKKNGNMLKKIGVLWKKGQK